MLETTSSRSSACYQPQMTGYAEASRKALGCFHGFQIGVVKPKITAFKFDTAIAKGEYGTVYKVKCTVAEGCSHALKVVNIKDSDREIKNLTYVNKIGHPNIIKYFGFLDDQDKRYIALELGDISLDSFLAAKAPQFEASHFNEFAFQLLDMMSYLETIRLKYLDFKFENIVFDLKSALIKLVDFDLCLTGEEKGYSSPLFALRNIAYRLACLQIKIKYSESVDISKSEELFTRAFQKLKFTLDDSVVLKSDVTIWNKQLTATAKEIVACCFVKDKHVRMEIVQRRSELEPRITLIFD